MDKHKLSLLKSATVGIGVLIDPQRHPRIEVYGTGFFVNSTGYVITANHVVQRCLKSVAFHLNKVNIGLVAIRLVRISQIDMGLNMLAVNTPYVVNLGIPNTAEKSGLTHTADLDIAVLRPKESDVTGTPFLKIKKSSSIELYKEIAMCGYPSGNHSLNISNEALTLRMSPIMQFGKIAGLMPSDEAEYPYAIQTDIVGTGGSSGSPIIELETGEVIALAQKVLPATVGGNALFKQKSAEATMEGEIFAISNIGLVYGLSHNLLYGIPEGTKKAIEEGITFSDSPKFSRFMQSGIRWGNKS